MKKIFCIFVGILLVIPAVAEIVPNTKVVTRSYVEGAYDSIDAAKQDKLTSTNVVVGTDNGPFVSAVTASNGTVTITKSEVTIPVGSTSSSTRAVIWLE